VVLHKGKAWTARSRNDERHPTTRTLERGGQCGRSAWRLLRLRADTFLEAGSYVEWVVTVAQAVTTTLVIRYANGATAKRPMAVKVNGAFLIMYEQALAQNWR
jgi:hypothetical protein